MLLPLPGGPETLLILLLALLVDAAVGDSRLLDRMLPTPGALAADATRWADKRLNRIDRTDGARRLRGTLLAIVLALAALAAGAAITVLARFAPWGWAIELLVVTRAIAIRKPWAGLRDVLVALDTGGVDAGRDAVAPLTDRQSWSLDLHGVVRAGAEATARDLDRRVVGPILWYVLLGLPGLLLWSAVDGMGRVIGHATPRHVHFGRTAATLVRLLGWLPARLTVVLIAAAALFVPRAAGWPALRAAVRFAPAHPAGNAAWPMAAFAGALGLALGGPRREGDRTVSEPWLGDGRARAMPKDLRPALVLFHVAVIVAAALVAGAGLLALRFL